MEKMLRRIKHEALKRNNKLHQTETAPFIINISNYQSKQQELKGVLGTRRKIHVDLGGGSATEKIDVSYMIRSTVDEKLKQKSDMQQKLRRDIMQQLRVKDGPREGAALAYKAIMLGRYSMEESDETLIE